MAKLLDENGLEIVKNWISDNFFPKNGGGELVLSPNESIRIKSSNGNYIGILKGNSRFTLVDYYDNDTGEYNGFGIELDGQGDGAIRLGGDIECNSVRILNLYITTREGDLELNVDKAKELGILS